MRAVQAKQANTFLIHGTVADLVPVRSSSGLRFLSLESFLQQELFTGWPALITYNRAEGLGFSSPEARGHFQEKLKSYDAVHGTSYAQALPRDPGNAFALLDSYFRSCAMAQPPRPVVMMLPFADTVVPAGDASYRTPEDRAVLVYLRKWSQDPTLLAKNIVVVLVTETLAEIDPKLLRANAAREVEIVRPDQRGRLEYLEAVRPPDWYAKMCELEPVRLAELTAGMTRVQLGQILDGADAAAAKITRDEVRRTKKEVIETEGLGLLEYVEPKYDLSMVAGMPAVKERLRRAARAIARGNPAAVPMGYLICGPVGSAKTFLVECFSNEIGFPCVKLKNFRSMWVGSTEANLERILKILASLDPGRRDHRRGRCRARKPRRGRRLRHPEPRLRPDRGLHGRHPQSRKDPLVPDHLPARPSPHRLEAPGPGRRARSALLSGDRGRVRRDLPGDAEEARDQDVGRRCVGGGQ